MKRNKPGFCLLSATLALVTAFGVQAADNERLIVADEPEDLLMLDEGGDEVLILDEGADADDSLLIGEGGADESEAGDDTGTFSPPATLSASLDHLWLEAGQFIRQSASKNLQAYAHGLASMEWNPAREWEFRLSARVDGYVETGRDDWSDLDLDYDESYLRYKSTSSIATLGAQKVLWGRIDEFPPTDRLSSQDLRRFIIDDLEDRRLASPALRLEHFFDGNGKVDLVYYPRFREAQLADRDSAWHPVNKHSGEILGLKTTAPAEAIVRQVPVVEDAPDSEGGAGARFSSIGSGIDYGISVQKGRQSIPYFSYHPTRNRIEGRFPRTWILGGDLGVEALGGTLKFEASWLSDTPVTRIDGSYTTVRSAAWGAALELFPGDGDARLNLQVTGTRLLNAPRVRDRDGMYALNGSYETPFAEQRWRARARFYLGMDEKDLYLNPEIAYTGWEAQEIYLELHFFDGDKGTPGGFYQDNNIVALGWRADF
ncbi:MAG: hypothetical protein ACK5HY_17080 [Parahaliea sp.]